MHQPVADGMRETIQEPYLPSGPGEEGACQKDREQEDGSEKGSCEEEQSEERGEEDCEKEEPSKAHEIGARNRS